MQIQLREYQKQDFKDVKKKLSEKHGTMTKFCGPKTASNLAEVFCAAADKLHLFTGGRT